MLLWICNCWGTLKDEEQQKITHEQQQQQHTTKRSIYIHFLFISYSISKNAIEEADYT